MELFDETKVRLKKFMQGFITYVEDNKDAPDFPIERVTCGCVKVVYRPGFVLSFHTSDHIHYSVSLFSLPHHAQIIETSDEVPLHDAAGKLVFDVMTAREDNREHTRLVKKNNRIIEVLSRCGF